jgi:uncharacterized lipoprotein YmbA
MFPGLRSKLAQAVGPWVAVFLVGTGCVSRPTPRVYVLGTPAESWSAPASPAGAPRVQVQRMLLPDYLDTTDLVLRSGAHQLTVSSTGRWGERLSLGLTDALAAALAARLSEDWVTLDQGNDRTARQLRVQVTALDCWPDGHCVLAATWSVVRRNGGTLREEGRGTYDIPAAGADAVGDAAVVAAVAQAVGRLADGLTTVLAAPSEGRSELSEPGSPSMR